MIYKDLTRSSKHPLGGNAYLTLDNTEEPYLGGIRFTAMPPMKRFRDMDQLSGGILFTYSKNKNKNNNNKKKIKIYIIC